MTRRWMAAAALVGAVAAVSPTGCHRSQKKQAEQAAAAIEGMAAIPRSADVVLGADVAALAKSALVQRAVGQMMASDPGLSDQLGKLFKGCGFDPAQDLRTVLVAMDTDSGSALLVATGKLSEGEIASCVGRRMAAVGGRLVQTPLGKRTEYHADAPPGRTDVWFAFGKSDTVVVSSSPAYLAEALGDGPRLSGDPDMAELVARARVERAALWAAGRVAPQVGAGLKAATGGQVGPPKALFGHVVLDSGLDAQLGVVLASAADANKAVSLAKKQLTVLAQLAQKWDLGRLVARVKVRADRDTLLIGLALDQSQLHTLLAPIDRDAGPDQTTAPLKSPGNTGQSGDQHR